MMSMEISDGADLLTGRRSGGVVNYWRSRTKMERILLVVMAVMSVALLGFIIGVAVLDGKGKHTRGIRNQLHSYFWAK
ncbi:putative cell wall integrity and stress response component 4-like [Homarus americanus]|uniref:Putative cell wall integrity and stress response component 4-like n=1 Tax=Homarus americanus TaxID=6706 RepID=A0A8J5N1X1_HOMAM|nr:putative cell wall integrity and stress response component 4-like [Homarus americanus]